MNIKNLFLYGLTLSLFLFTSSCQEDLWREIVKAPPSSIERDVKGHDQIFSIQATLYMALKSANKKFYVAYEANGTRETPIPVYQQIELRKDERGSVSITSRRKHFDVVKSKNIFYALELRYFDVNGKLINYQFSGYDEKDQENSTLLHHQHFFTIDHHGLNKQEFTYPMTLDSTFIDRYLFKYKLGTTNKLDRATISSPSNIYVPSFYQPGSLKYDAKLVERALELVMKKGVEETYTHPSDGRAYKLYKTLGKQDLAPLSKELFHYEYRDTDPVEEYLGSKISFDDLDRPRLGQVTQRLQKWRDLKSRTDFDHLGFKGILSFKRSNLAFQMRICICHILANPGRKGATIPGSKYTKLNGREGINDFYEISPSWNTFDIDYPLPFRVIADTDDTPEKLYKDIQRFYPDAKPATIKRLFEDGANYLYHMPKKAF